MTEAAQIRDLNRIIHRYSETHGHAAVDVRRPDARPVAVGARDLPRPASSRDVEMIAAYFAPTWAMLRRIARVGERGRARIITAAKSDNDATIAAARHTYSRLLRRGVEIFEYAPTKLHSKLVVLDDVVHIGSSNFDIRSLYLNLEMMLRVDDPAFATMMRAYFERELRRLDADHAASCTSKRSTWFNRLRWAVSFFLVTSADYSRHAARARICRCER